MRPLPSRHSLAGAGPCWQWPRQPGERPDGGLDQQYTVELGEGFLTTLEPLQTRIFFHARAFAPYENARLGGNFHSLEQTLEGILLKRTKTTALIPADPSFHAARTLAKRLF